MFFLNLREQNQWLSMAKLKNTGITFWECFNLPVQKFLTKNQPKNPKPLPQDETFENRLQSI